MSPAIVRPTQSTSSVNRTSLLAKFWDGVIAMLLAILAQLLIAGIERLLGPRSGEFPPSILAMTAVFGFISIMSLLVSGVEDFYHRYLRCAADLLNRHMSIGFTIPFIMICRNPMADGRTVGQIIACFLMTGVINTFVSYFLALPIQSLVGRWDKRFLDCNSSSEVGGDGIEGRLSKQFWLSSKSDCLERGLRDSDQSAPCDESSATSGQIEPPGHDEVPAEMVDNTLSGWWSRLFEWALHNPLLLLFWLLTLTVGIPLRYKVQNDAILGICLHIAVWLTTLAIQTAIKTNQRLRPWLRTILFGVFNAVLWTSLVMMTFVLIDGSISDRPLPEMLNTLQTNTPLSELILQISSKPDSSPSVAAGDIALSILNAGLVSWGLKLYEYRRQLLSRAGLTVFLVSSALAIGNLVLGPLSAHAVGLGPAGRDVAFAARSVTLALGSPVMAMMDGDDGLNAAMVVVSGIIFQMGLGFGVGTWLEKKVHSVLGGCRRRVRAGRAHVPNGVIITTTTTTTTTTSIAKLGDSAACGDSATAARGEDDIEAQRGDAKVDQMLAANDPRTVAAGITIGINSAAMGTAYLYEVKSDAAPYSALSMIALGLMTVTFSTIGPLTGWILDQISITTA
ncbi:hypothetical protein B0H66DRAFT_602244 [Apodospora peruviana]|uniref:LrgB-like protein n=1 Tax=Apodospora peruviana TaxID=516989 RepID=A0AAE0M7X8_9PEZI|nr:hypothetical protein B0H66DRAFT_602244 [Apodospora peruviana]